jgi:hypothetical protein
MDLEEFDDPVDRPGSIDFSGDKKFIEGLELLDDRWFLKATRSARWMDLLGDYAGTEPFVIDGRSSSASNLFPFCLSCFDGRRSSLSGCA